MPTQELGILLDEYARPAARQNLELLARMVGNFVSLNVSEGKISGELPDRVLVAGGDQSVRIAVQALVDRDEVKPIGVVRGGTVNTLFQRIHNNGVFMHPQDFANRTLEDFPQECHLKVGLAGKLAFVNHIGFGTLEQNAGRLNERLRRLLARSSRPWVVRGVGLLSILWEQNSTQPAVDIYSISNTMGNIRVFPHQDLRGDLVSHVRLENHPFTQRFRDVWEVVLWTAGFETRNLLLECSDSYLYQPKSPYLWIDGDTIPNPIKKETTIRRWERSIPIVAIT